MGRSSQIQDAGAMATLVPATNATAAIILAKTPLPSAPSAAAILKVPGTGRLRNRLFEVQLSGALSNASAGTATFTVQVGTDVNPANNTTIASSGAITVGAGATIPYSGTLRLIYDSIAGTLFGSQSWIVNGTVVVPATITGTVTGLLDTNEPVFNMVHGVALSVVNAASYVLPDTFAIEA